MICVPIGMSAVHVGNLHSHVVYQLQLAVIVVVFSTSKKAVAISELWDTDALSFRLHVHVARRVKLSM